MAAIIRLSSKKFLNEFIKKYDYKNYNFLLISEDIKTTKKYKNVYSLKKLIPPTTVISEFINNGNSDKYIRKYINYLERPEIEVFITIMVKLAVIDNSNVVLLCSENEKDYRYIDIICQYIEQVYDIKTYSYKKYKKNPKKCETVKNKKEVSKLVMKKIKKAEISSKTTYVDRVNLKSELKNLSIKELKTLCKQNDIEIYPDYTKKEIINEILAVY